MSSQPPPVVSLSTYEKLKEGDASDNGSDTNALTDTGSASFEQESGNIIQHNL